MPCALDGVDLVRGDGGHLGGVDASEITRDLLNTVDCNDTLGRGINDDVSVVCLAVGNCFRVCTGDNGDRGAIANFAGLCWYRVSTYALAFSDVVQLLRREES